MKINLIEQMDYFLLRTKLFADSQAAGNSGFAKKQVMWLIEHSTSHQLLWYVDRLVLLTLRSE